MFYITLILIVVLAFCILVFEIKSIKKSSAIRKGLTENKVIWTRNEELLIIWLLITYLILVLYLICYLFVFDRGAVDNITTEMVKKILWYAILVLIVPMNIAIILPVCFIAFMSRKIAPKDDIKADKKLMLATFTGYFIVVAACTVCMKYKIVSPLTWFSILTYAKILALGLISRALKQ